MTYLRPGLSLTATLALTVSTLASSALAQEEPGIVGTLRFSQGIEISDNPSLTAIAPDTVITSRTSLDFGFESETTTQVFIFNLGGDLVRDFNGGTTNDFEVENTRAHLEYRRQGIDSELSFFADVTETQLDDEVGLTETGTLVIDTGSLTSSTVGIGFEIGRESPFGFDFDASFNQRDYQDTTDPDLDDTDILRLDALARFNLSESLAVRARAGRANEKQEDASNTEITDTYFGIGVEGDTAGGLTFVGDLLFDRTETVTGSVVSEDGVGFELALTQDRFNGSVGANFTSRIDDSGRRTTASVRRDIELEAGALGFSFGVVDQESDSTLRYVAGLDYTRETPRGALTAALSQAPSTDDGDPIISTTFSLGYSAEINEVSGWSADFSYLDTNDLLGTDDDSSTSATFSYRRDLTEEWDMNAGYSYTRVNESGSADRSRNTIFFNIQRDISFGF